MARTIQLLNRVNVGPVTNQTTPTITIAAGERQWIARLDPDHDYPTVVWDLKLEWSFDGAQTWTHWRSAGGTGIVLNPDKNVYPSIGGAFPADTTPTHLRGVITLSERIRIGLIAITP